MNLLNHTGLGLVVAMTLSACAGSGDSSSQSGVQSDKAQNSNGIASVAFVGHGASNKRKVLNFSAGSQDGQVVCEVTPTGLAIVSMGSFYKANYGLNKSHPLTGLSVSIPNARDGKSKDTKQAFLNIDDSSVSQPSCMYFPTDQGSTTLKGSVQCTDDGDREGWGRMTVTATFSCEP